MMNGRDRRYHYDNHHGNDSGYNHNDQTRYDDRREHIPLSNINPGYEDGTEGEYPRGTFHDVGPSIPLDRRESDASSYHSETEHGARRRSAWAKEEMPRDAAILLQELPSKQLEKMASDLAHNTNNGSIKRRNTKRMSHHAMLHIPAGKNVADEMIRAYRDDPDPEGPDDEEIKALNMGLTDKRRLRTEMSLKRKEPKNVSRWKRFKYNCGITWKHFKYNMAEVGYFFKLWTGHMKKIEGHFGTGVLSYFLFLKWLFYINIPVFVLTFGFVVLPQILYRHLKHETGGYTQNVSFTGLELLTGSYWFNETELYYGYYTGETFEIIDDSRYDMKLAYLFTCGGYYLLCIFILAFSISKSYKKNYIEGSGAFDFYYVSRVFCGWDYGITAKNSALLKHKGIYIELKEYLAGTRTVEEEKTCGQKCTLFSIRVLTNLVILGMIGGAGWLIYFISDSQSVNVDIPVLSEMAMPLVVSGVNLIWPFVFALIARAEQYEKPKNELYINMTRTMVLKAVTLGVLVSFWYQKLDTTCRETFIGQQIYRLVIVDFIFMLLTTFFLEFGRRLCAQYCCKTFDYPEFEIGRNTLNLIYSQALCWLGTYFAPMLSLVMIIKLFIMFYIKRVSVIQNCKPSLKPWRASRSHTIFMFFLFLFCLGATGAVAYAVIFVKPSTACGPFRNHTSSYQVVTELVDSWQGRYPALHEAIDVISSPGFIAAVLVVLVVLTYYTRIVMVGHKEMVDLLRQQLAMEGRDKAYLLNMLQAAHRTNKDRPPRAATGQVRMTGSEASGTIESRAPGGRHFAKKLAEAADRMNSDSMTSLNKSPRKHRNDGHGGASSAL